MNEETIRQRIMKLLSDGGFNINPDGSDWFNWAQPSNDEDEKDVWYIQFEDISDQDMKRFHSILELKGFEIVDPCDGEAGVKLPASWLDTPPPALTVHEPTVDVGAEDEDKWQIVGLNGVIADLQRQLAAVREDNATVLKYLNMLFDDAARFDTTKDSRFVTETLYFATTLLENDSQAAPPTQQPAAGQRERVAGGLVGDADNL